MIKVLIHRSDGNFLFVKQLLHFRKYHLHNDADKNRLPMIIGDIYESCVRREFGSRETFKAPLSVLEVSLVAAFEKRRSINMMRVLRLGYSLLIFNDYCGGGNCTLSN